MTLTRLDLTDCLREIGQAPPEKTKESVEGVSKYKQLFRLREVHLMAFFIFAYVGTEVTIGGKRFGSTCLRRL